MPSMARGVDQAALGPTLLDKHAEHGQGHCPGRSTARGEVLENMYSFSNGDMLACIVERLITDLNCTADVSSID